MLQQLMVSDCDDTNADVWRTGDFYVDADADTYGTGEAVSLCYGAASPVGYAIQAETVTIQVQRLIRELPRYVVTE